MSAPIGRVPVRLTIDGLRQGHAALSQTVLDQAPIGMVIKTADDRIIWANAAMTDVLGAEHAELFERPFLSFVHPDNRAAVEAESNALISGGESAIARDFCWQNADGSTRMVTSRVSIALDDSGMPLASGETGDQCLIYQLVDNTERAAAQQQLATALDELQARNEELERSNEELTQFAYVASHDLSEPLRVIAGHVELLKRRYAGQLDDDADRYIEFAVDGCSRMRTLIEDLLRYSRAGRELDLQPVNCASLVERVRVDLLPKLAATGATLVVDPALPTVTADGSQLMHVFQNLVSNALKYSRADTPPLIRVSSERGAHGWRISVADNGIGIPVHQRQRVFRIFQRLHGREIPGTGIGLAICRKVVEQHHGVIEVTDNEAGGATFVFTLPDGERLLK